MVMIERVLITEHDIRTSCIAGFVHIVDIAHPLTWQIAEVQTPRLLL